MDAKNFDAITKALMSAGPRRHTLGGFLTAVITLLAMGGSVAAKRNRRLHQHGSNHQRRKQNDRQDNDLKSSGKGKKKRNKKKNKKVQVPEPVPTLAPTPAPPPRQSPPPPAVTCTYDQSDLPITQCTYRNGDCKCSIPEEAWGFDITPFANLIRVPAFLKSCLKHDECFTECGTTVEECGAQFLADLTAVCALTIEGLLTGNCLVFAAGYAEAVTYFPEARTLHAKAQQEVCCDQCTPREGAQCFASRCCGDLVCRNGHCVREPYVFVRSWGGEGSGDGQFADPRGIAVASDGTIYVADSWNNRVQVFTPEGTFLRKWGSSGTGPGQLLLPRWIALDSEHRVYVADATNDRVKVFSQDGAFIREWNLLNETFPSGIVIDGNDQIYIVDRGSERIQKFTLEGAFLTAWGTRGQGDGQFQLASGIALGHDNNVYVAETANRRVQVFSPDGTFLRKWSTPVEIGALPVGIAVAQDGKIFVAEDILTSEGEPDYRIRIFTPDGTPVATWGILGNGDGAFGLPQGVAIDGNDHIYVADSDNYRIQVFAPAGTNLIASERAKKLPAESQTSEPSTRNRRKDSRNRRRRNRRANP